MAVYKTKTGKWQAVISYRDENGTPRKKKKTFELKREAQNYEVEFLKRLENDIDESMTYQDVVNHFLNKKKISIRESSYNDIEFLIDKFANHLYPKKYIQLKRKDFLNIWIKINESDYSWSRKNKAIRLIKAIGRYGYTYFNYPDLTKTMEIIPKKDGDVQTFEVWSPDQFNLFINEVEDYTLKVMFTLLYRTGMRRGEARALLKSDLDNSTIKITKSIRRNEVDRLKNYSSRRTIGIDSDLNQMLQPLLKTDGDYLFGGLQSISNSMLQRTFTSAIESANKKLIESDSEPIPIIRIHDLRHSHASVLINNGANIVAVSKRLGHSNVNTTLKTYTHLIKKSEDELVNLIDSIY